MGRSTLFCIDWEKWHGWMFQRWLILKLTCEHKKPHPASIANHLLLWMNVMFDFICIDFAMKNAKKTTNSKWKWMSLAGIKPAWIKATRCNISIKLIMVRYNILELTVRQNLHFFYQCRCNLLLFTELGMNTGNHNTFDKCIGKCWFFSYAVIV